MIIIDKRLQSLHFVCVVVMDNEYDEQYKQQASSSLVTQNERLDSKRRKVSSRIEQDSSAVGVPGLLILLFFVFN